MWKTKKNIILASTNRLFNSREYVSQLFDDYSIILQRLPIALAQVKSCNTSENLLNESPQIIYSLYWLKQITEKVFNNIMNSI